MKMLCSLLALAICASLAPAECRVVHRAAVVQHAVVQHHAAVVAAVFQPLVVQVPTYSVGYSPEALFGRGQPQHPATDPALQKLLEEVQKIRGEVEAIKSQGSPKLEPVPAPNQPKTEPLQPLPQQSKLESPSHVKVFAAKCASCHDATVAGKKGGGFTLMEGANLVALSDKQKLAVVRSIYSGDMPRGGKISDEEVSLIITSLK